MPDDLSYIAPVDLSIHLAELATMTDDKQRMNFAEQYVALSFLVYCFCRGESRVKVRHAILGFQFFLVIFIKRCFLQL